MNDDSVFLARALKAVRNLERYIQDNPRAAHRLSQAETDVQCVLTRYMVGAYCSNGSCRRRAGLPPIESGFCCNECRERSRRRDLETEARIQEAVAEHLSSQEPL